MCDLPGGCDLMLIDDAVWILAQKTNNPAYDFAFDAVMACRRPWHRPDDIIAVARVGAPENYDTLYKQMSECNINLVNSPRQHLNGSELPEWYPCLEDVTPKSAWFDSPPQSVEVAELIGWPVFVKGAWQTSRHDPRKCIARNATEYEVLVEEYRRDSILSW